MQRLSLLIDNTTVETIRQSVVEAERMGELTASQLDVIYKNGWFNLFVPKAYGGLELSLPKALRLEETLAWIDGSFGWTITLCSGANWFIGFFQPEAAQQIFSTNKVCLAGSGRPSGIAKIINNGYEISGEWDYATGAPHATVFTANCMMEKEGVLLRDEKNEPIVRSFWFTSQEVTIHRNWKSTGMIATASHRFVVNKLNVPLHRSFIIDPSHVILPQAIYRFPFGAFAECTLAVNSAGMAVRFFELMEEIVTNNKKIDNRVYSPTNPSTITLLRNLLEEAKATLDAKRETFYTTVDQSWQLLHNSSSISEELLQQIATDSRALAFTALQLTDQLYPYAGLAASDPFSELNRVWRDLHTASQHPLLRFPYL
jgi:alkylation response protein AidB-like acyl-CoA dehydrogenase